jgi:hypothetical protein
MRDDLAPPLPPSEALRDRVARDDWAKFIFKDSAPEFYNPVLLIGDEPFEAPELAAFLRGLGITSWVIEARNCSGEQNGSEDGVEIVGNRAPIVVLGRCKWSTLALASLIADECITATPLNKTILYEMATYWLETEIVNDDVTFRRSPHCRNLIFAPQEMLLKRLFSRLPLVESLPFKKAPTVAEVLAGFDKIVGDCANSRMAFRWPATDAPVGNGRVSQAEWPQIGVLSYVGYNVGINGQVREGRQQILQRVFERELPLVHSPQHMAQWDVTKSAPRLKKIAESIAAFCRNAKRRQRANMKRTIDNYQDDLEWLKRTFYDGRFDGSFRWPNT